VLAPALRPAALTVAAWVKTRSTKIWQCVVENGDADTVGWHVYVRDGNQLYSNLGGEALYSELHAIAPNTWNHVAVSWDGANVRHYVNGRLVGTDSANSLRPAGRHTIIGMRTKATSPPYGFDGCLDDVQIYDRSLNAREIRQLSARDLDPLAHWKLDHERGARL
jgi:hypothetical protein